MLTSANILLSVAIGFYGLSLGAAFLSPHRSAMWRFFIRYALAAAEWLTLNIGIDYKKAVYDGQEPRNKVDLLVTLTPLDKLTIACDISWQDEKIVPLYDPSYTKIRWEEDAVTTVDLTANYNLLRFMDIFAG